ncbi:MAG: helix-turn-helix transcriptional regulator [Hymenobacteraceae bacterium]|nr:helix-turn-helix transcriptional regulator [Hymenobacteraceae bacterium]MDX5394816.1 helix-turn-helix transcriptional regulator [Hymenobacteraceae bacterium]MDX5443066.1 helix-turn-helix transcriptional regulator [Hymenobacteraceae bacterium]MDX5510850.1 helix-turn-helix transcriptional regulator [Hymenobacteraceae bacterium]
MEKRPEICVTHILPIRDALDVLSGKWKIPILVTLYIEKRRFRDMLRFIPGLTAKMLSKELKELELNQLVKRTVYDTSPVTVEYSITEHGIGVWPVIESLKEWGQKHREQILTTEDVAV